MEILLFDGSPQEMALRLDLHEKNAQFILLFLAIYEWSLAGKQSKTILLFISSNQSKLFQLLSCAERVALFETEKWQQTPLQ